MANSLRYIELLLVPLSQKHQLHPYLVPHQLLFQDKHVLLLRNHEYPVPAYDDYLEPKLVRLKYLYFLQVYRISPKLILSLLSSAAEGSH